MKKRTVDTISAQIGPEKTIALLVLLSTQGQSGKRKLDRIMDNSMSGVTLIGPRDDISQFLWLGCQYHPRVN